MNDSLCVLCGFAEFTKRQFDVGLMCDDANGCRRRAVVELRKVLPNGVDPGAMIAICRTGESVLRGEGDPYA